MDHTELTTALDRLAAASAALEQLATRINEADESTITRIVAQVEDRRTAELEAKLTEMQQTIAQENRGLHAHRRCQECQAGTGRKTRITGQRIALEYSNLWSMVKTPSPALA